MTSFLEKIQNFLHLKNKDRPVNKTDSSVKREKPVRISVSRNLIKSVYLPYPPSARMSIVPMVKGSVYFPFEKALSYGAVSGEYTSSDLFGTGEIAINNQVANYILPIHFPQEKTAFGVPRLFTLEAVSGNDLIFYLRGPLIPTQKLYRHYLYCFETDNKRWCRIVSVDKDGSYKKEPIPFYDDSAEFPPESVRNAYSGDFGMLLVWSTEPGKIRVELDDTPEDFHRDYIYESGPQINRYYEEMGNAKRMIETERSLHLSAYGNVLKLEESVRMKNRFDFIPLYEIYGIENYIKEQDISFKQLPENKDAHIFYEKAIFFKRYSENMLGVFISYFVPRTWEKGVFLLFEYEENV
ncbi:MAG: hypothetical protein GY795_12330 [Desulfobacterales bacterium]|nr:hypothetical protein [Desulfobacterales bacterium]